MVPLSLALCIDLHASNGKFPGKSRQGNGTSLYKNVDYQFLWVFVGEIREILDVSVEGRHF